MYRIISFRHVSRHVTLQGEHLCGISEPTTLCLAYLPVIMLREECTLQSFSLRPFATLRLDPFRILKLRQCVPPVEWKTNRSIA